MQKLVTLFCLITTIGVFGQNQFGQIDSLLSEIERKQVGMGSLCISKGGKQVYSRAIGFSDLKNDKKSNTETKYRIGSLSKTFTSVVIMKLVEEKKLKLNTKLSKFYPKFPDSKKITIEHLLSHRTGLFNFTSNPGYFNYNHLPQTKEVMLDKMLAGPQQFKPGERFQYSNTNFVLLTYIAEDVTGKDFYELVKTYITDPLNLKYTDFGGTTESAKNEAYSYNNLGTWYQEKSTDMSVPEGAGAIESTPSEVNKFLYALFNNKLLSEKTVEQMKTFKDTSNYGLGLYLIKTDTLTMLGHTGGVDGFQTFGFYNDSLDLNVTYISNATSYPAWDIFQNAVKSGMGVRFEYPELVAQEVPEEGELKDFEGLYSTQAFPLKLDVTVENDSLFAQATGQGQFPLSKIGLNLFEYIPAGIKILFDPKINSLVLVQQGVRIDFKRE